MDDSELDAKEKSYLSSKYTPLTVRLSEHIAKNKGWTGECGEIKCQMKTEYSIRLILEM